MTVKNLVASKLPFSHYFDNGIIGTGTSIFSKARIQDVTFHEFGLNGYPHKLAHGDWFGGKGLGVCKVDFRGFNIHLFISHYHATYDYNPITDTYLGHRVVHGVESAQWIKLSSSSADLTVYAGDFNTEPKDIPYKIVRHVTPLRCVQCRYFPLCQFFLFYCFFSSIRDPEMPGKRLMDHQEERPVRLQETLTQPSMFLTSGSSMKNCFRSSLKESPNGKRIDYIMYNSGPNIQAETVYCALPLPDRIPGEMQLKCLLNWSD